MEGEKRTKASFRYALLRCVSNKELICNVLLTLVSRVCSSFPSLETLSLRFYGWTLLTGLVLSLALGSLLYCVARSAGQRVCSGALSTADC
jgi:hypothetical protein